jgi:putative toxin-antitoxin system antitoxin component (TIGR02293 family)
MKCHMAAGSAFTTGRLVSLLGGRRAVRSGGQDLDKLRLRLRKGLPYDSVVALSKAYKIDLKGLAVVLAIPERTLARRKQDKRLRPDESDRLFRVARIAALAEEAFGAREKAARWLHRPNRALGNAIPLHHLDTELGAREVEDVLGRIAHGVYS